MAYNCECRFKVAWEDLSPSVQARFKSIEESSNYNNIISSMNSKIESLQSQINIIQNSILDYDNKLNNITNNIPKKVSDLINDSNYQTKDQVDKSISDTANSLTNTIEQNYYSKLDLKHRLRPPLKRNTSYLQGDICFHDSLPSYAYLECIQAGVTGPDEPSVLGGGGNTLVPPNSLPDGTALFRIKRFGDTGLIGQIIWYSGSRVPDNYLLCDGSQLNRNSYNELFKIIGITYGAGDNSTTFNIPLLIDHKFIEGSINPGIIKSPGLPNITGSFVADIQANQTDTNPRNIEAFGETYLTELTGAFDAVYRNQCPVFEPNTPLYGNMACGFRFNSAKCSALYGNSSTVQPHSITLLPLIKYI